MEYLKFKESGNSVSVESNAVYSYPTHMHSYYEMTLYEPFEGRIAVNDKDFYIQAPTCILIVPSDFHRIAVESGSSARFVKLGFEESILAVGNVPQASALLHLPSSDCFFADLFREICRNGISDRYRQTLVNTAVCTVMEHGIPILPVSLHTGYRLATAAVRIINERFGEPLTQRDVAQSLSVSPQYLSKVFAQTVGIGFSEHLSSVRLHRAAKLLTETDESVTQICYSCGFGNLSHFLRSFRAKFGISPGEYRKTFCQ